MTATTGFPPIGYATRPDAVRAGLGGATLLVSTPSQHPLADLVRRLARLGRRRARRAAP